jgi:hypothetical protein
MSPLPDRGEPPQPVQGAQYGDHNAQYNYFGPVTNNLFVGGFERLQDVRFDPAVLERDLDLGRFAGRRKLIDRIETFIATQPYGFVVVLGEAGVGKSSLAAHLVWTRPWLHHFTGLPGGRAPQAARKSLAAQIVARWGLWDWAPGGILPATAGSPDWFDRLLRAAARRRNDSEPGEPIVLVVDGLDEAEPEIGAGTGLPLGLPASLPDGVFVVATSRPGLDWAFNAIRKPADWPVIEVEGEDNLADMRLFVSDVTESAAATDGPLSRVLSGSGVDLEWFRQTLVQRCAGVWIYLRYVLDEIRDGTRDPRQIDMLPEDLAAYYAQQVSRWRGNLAFPADQARWDQVYLPLLGVLGAASAPLSAEELASFAGLGSEETVCAFVDETARAFLSRQDATGTALYAVRHQSFREFLSGARPVDRPGPQELARVFAAQNVVAHRHIAGSLIPAGVAGSRRWEAAGAYARDYLAVHAAACGLLDELVSDPGFLTVTRPEAVLAGRGKLRTQEGRRAFEAYELSLNEWPSMNAGERVAALEVKAAQTRARRLAAASAEHTATEWPVRWGAWAGSGHRALTSRGKFVYAVAIGKVKGVDVIVAATANWEIQVWDGATGALLWTARQGDYKEIRTVAVARIGGRDVIIAGADGGTVRTWTPPPEKRSAARWRASRPMCP